VENVYEIWNMEYYFRTLKKVANEFHEYNLDLVVVRVQELKWFESVYRSGVDSIVSMEMGMLLVVSGYI